MGSLCYLCLIRHGTSKICDVFASTITSLVNAYFTNGMFPDLHKHSVVRPLIKQAQLHGGPVRVEANLPETFQKFDLENEGQIQGGENRD